MHISAINTGFGGQRATLPNDRARRGPVPMTSTLARTCGKTRILPSPLRVVPYMVELTTSSSGPDPSEPPIGDLSPTVTVGRLLSPAQLSAYLAVPRSTVYRWTSMRDGSGPKYSKIGKHVRYDMVNVQSWLASRQVPQRGDR